MSDAVAFDARPDRAPPVAVLIAAKDAGATVARAVASALSEPEAAEVCVIDDGSADDTAECARACDDGTGRLIVERRENRGPSAARNRALALTRSPVVCVLDADDFLDPGRFRRLFEAARGRAWDFLADDLDQVAEGDEGGPRQRLRGIEGDAALIDLEGFVRGNLQDPRRRRGELGFLKPLMRREFLDAHDLRYDEAVRLGEDYLLYARALAAGAKFLLTPACGYVAVVRPDSLSGRHGTRDLKALLDADERLLALPDLDPRAREALRRHRADTRRKWAYRAALDAKKDGRWGEVFARVFDTPATAAWIGVETLRAKLRREAA